MKINKNFSTIAVILIVVVLFFIGGIAYYLKKNSNNSLPTKENTIQAKLIKANNFSYSSAAKQYEGLLVFQDMNDSQQHEYFLCTENLGDWSNVKLNQIYNLKPDYYVSNDESMETYGCLPLLPQQTLPGTSGDSLPTEIGNCTATTVSKVGTRLMDGGTGEEIAGSGSAINYSDGGYQVSYDEISGINNSKIGDNVFLCLISIPTNCPKGDNRGKVYAATNLRTGETWQAQDSEHGCGGA